MDSTTRSGVLSFEHVKAKVPGPPGLHYANAFERGSLRVLLSLPVAANKQSPHEQDEIYLVVAGSGVLYHDGKRDRFARGDVMFIAAGTDHRFEDFTDDLTVWVVFFGPKGGEPVPDT